MIKIAITELLNLQMGKLLNKTMNLLNVINLYIGNFNII